MDILSMGDAVWPEQNVAAPLRRSVDIGETKSHLVAAFLYLCNVPQLFILK